MLLSGACGGINSESDFVRILLIPGSASDLELTVITHPQVVALNTAQWDGGAHCGKQITMTYGGKTTTATIVDEVRRPAAI
jgi:hypothetical protein